jgi:hypothetical protein
MYVTSMKPNMIYATAALIRNGASLRKDEVILKQKYTIAGGQAEIIGNSLQVIAGPHADYCMSEASDDVFTVLLLTPVEGAEKHVQFFNSDIAGGWSYTIIHVM